MLWPWNFEIGREQWLIIWGWQLIGEAGQKQLVEAKSEGEKGLAAFFEKEKALAKDVLGPGGMPPLPSGLHSMSVEGKKRYELLGEQSYGVE